MAPELIKGEDYNNKVDIWAFGCLIYELLTLKICFYDENLFALYDKIVNKNYENINLKGYNSKWKNLIDLLLQKNPNQRPDIKEINKLIIKINNGTNNLIIKNNDLKIIGIAKKFFRKDLFPNHKDSFIRPYSKYKF